MVTLNKCLCCGKKIKGRKKKYCSAKCRNRYNYVKYHDVRWPKRKKCIVCHKEFLVGTHMTHKKYCSRRCENINYRNLISTKHKIFCLHCKKEIITASTRRRYCCKECRAKYSSLNRSHRPSEAYLKKNFPYFTCQNCGHRFRLNFNPMSEEGKPIFRYMKCPKCAKR